MANRNIRLSVEETAHFVKLYRDQDNLWNMYSPEYRNLDLRIVSRQYIVNELKVPEFTLNDVAKKVKALRSTYYLELKKINKSKARGGGADTTYRSSLPWFNDMDYIIKTASFKEKDTSSNLDTKTQWTTDAESDLETSTCSNNEEFRAEMSEPISSAGQLIRANKIALQQPARARNMGKKRRFEEIIDAVREIKVLNQQLCTPTKPAQEDECEIMGKQIAIQLRELSVRDRVLANFEIQKTLMNFRLRNINPSELTISSGRPDSSTTSISHASFNSYTTQPSSNSQNESYEAFKFSDFVKEEDLSDSNA